MNVNMIQKAVIILSAFPFLALYPVFVFILSFLPGDVLLYQGSYRHIQPHLCQIFAPG